MPETPEESPLYAPLDTASQELLTLKKASENPTQQRGKASPQAKSATLEQRVASIEKLLASIHGRHGITVKLPIISQTGGVGSGSGRTNTEEVYFSVAGTSEIFNVTMDRA